MGILKAYKKYFKNSFLLIILLCFTTSLRAQTIYADYLTGINSVNSIDIIGNDVWVGCELGVIRINKENLQEKEKISNVFADQKPGYCFDVHLQKDNNNGVYMHNHRDLFYLTGGTFNHLVGELWAMDMYIDENNVAWFITGWPEITRIENNNIIRLNPQNSSLPDVYYNVLCAENDVVWIGTTQDGIIKYDNGTATVITYPLPYSQITAMDIKNGILWAVCMTGVPYPYTGIVNALMKYSNGMWTKYDHLNSPIKDQSITRIKIVNDSLFLCTSAGLMMFDGLNWIVYNKELNGLKSDNVLSLAVDGNDLWIGTDEGLSVIRGNQTINIDVEDGPFNGSFQGSIIEDLNGTIWVGTAGTFGNLCKKQGENWVEVIGTDPENINSFHSLAVDSNNVVWATSYGSGLYRIQGDSITIYPGSFKSIKVDKYNNKWITTGDGIIKYNESVWTIYDDSDYENLHYANCIAADQKGNIWIGISQRGMVKFDGITWTPYDDSFFGYELSDVHKIIVDKDDNLWIDYSHNSSDMKICKFNGDSLQWFDASNIDLPPGRFGLLSIDKEENIWYSSAYGLAKYDWHEWKYFNEATTNLLNQEIRSFMIDSNNNKWLGSDCYLAKFNEETPYAIPDEKEIFKSQLKFSIYPNPTSNDFINVKANCKVQTVITASVIDMVGTILIEKEYSVQPDFSIELSDLKAGFYILQLVENGKSEIHKFIKY